MLPEIDEGEELFVRTDFSDDDLWDEACEAVDMSQFDLDTIFVDDRSYDGLGGDVLRTHVPIGFEGSALYVFDTTALDSTEHAMLVIGLHDMVGRHFRATVDRLYLVSGLLGRGNKGFLEFIAACDDDGVFRDESKLEVYD